MIAHKNRFHGQGSVRFAHRNSTTIRGPLFALKCLRNERRPTYRVAVVVSRKVSKSAVVRNRIRRRLYEVVRTSIAPHEPYDLIFVVHSDKLATCPASELAQLVRSRLRTARINCITNFSHVTGRASVRAER